MAMKSLAVIAVLVAVAVIVGANFTTGTAKPMSQIPITQAFRMHIGDVGNLNRKGFTMPFTVNAASQFAEAAAGSRQNNSTSASAFPTAPPPMPFRSASVARA